MVYRKMLWYSQLEIFDSEENLLKNYLYVGKHEWNCKNYTPLS